MISVIVPVYKVEDYLDQCVQSIVEQTYTNLEIILVDDGSPDRCPAMCDAWAERDERIKVIHKENGGISDARNAGIKIAKGKFLFFVDSDDYISKDCISIMYDVYQKTNINLVACGVVKVKGEQKLNDVGSNTVQGKFLNIMRRRGCWSVWGILYPAPLIKENHLQFQKVSFSEDVCWNSMVAVYAENMVYVEKALYYYRIRGDSLTSMWNDGDRVCDSYMQNAKTIHDFGMDRVLSPVQMGKLIRQRRMIVNGAWCELVLKRRKPSKELLTLLKESRFPVDVVWSSKISHGYGMLERLCVIFPFLESIPVYTVLWNVRKWLKKT